MKTLPLILALGACTSTLLLQAEPVTLTLDSSYEAVEAERDAIDADVRARLEQQQAALPAKQRTSLDGMTYLYTIRYIPWDGSPETTRSFVSAHAFGQGCACGDMLLLTNSGEESTPMTVAVIDKGKKNYAKEIELRADLAKHNVAADTSGPVLHWHTRDAWDCAPEFAIGVDCGTTTANEGCALSWAYDAIARCTVYIDWKLDRDEKDLGENIKPLRTLGPAPAKGKARPKPDRKRGEARLHATTHMGAARPLRVESQPLPKQEAADDDARPARHRYTVKQAVEGGTTFSFDSYFEYGHTYACGELLLFSNSGAKNDFQKDKMAVAVLDLAEGRVVEDELLIPATEHGVSHGSQLVHWVGRSDDGGSAGGYYTYIDWHLSDSVTGSADGFRIQLGADMPNPCEVIWSYDRASGRTALRLGDDSAQELPHRRSERPAGKL